MGVRLNCDSKLVFRQRSGLPWVICKFDAGKARYIASYLFLEKCVVVKEDGISREREREKDGDVGIGFNFFILMNGSSQS